MNTENVLFSSKNDRWLTPRLIIDRAVSVMGVIGLDPCSNSSVRPNVPALKHYTKDQDGMKQDWSACSVFLNPPYSRHCQYSILEWVDRLVGHYEIGSVKRAIALLPARTETKFFQKLIDFPVCFVDGRLRFEHETEGIKSSATFPSAVFYLGQNIKSFVEGFGDIGRTYVRYNRKI